MDSEERKGLRSYRVWKNFSDSGMDIAVIVDASDASDAQRKGRELLEDELPFGGLEGQRVIGYTVDQLF